MKPQQVLFWIAEYTDGTALPQYDPETGAENLFSLVDQSRLKSFGLYPFSAELAFKTGNLCNPFLPNYVLQLVEGEELEHFRRVHARFNQETGLTCEKLEYALGIKGLFVLMIQEDGNIHVGTSVSHRQGG